MLKMVASMVKEVKLEMKAKFKMIDDSLAAKAHKEALRTLERRVRVVETAVAGMSRKRTIPDEVDVEETGAIVTPVAHAVKIESEPSSSEPVEPDTVVAKRQRAAPSRAGKAKE